MAPPQNSLPIDAACFCPMKASRARDQPKPTKEIPVIPMPDSVTYGELPRYWGYSHLAMKQEAPIVFFEIGDSEGWPHTPNGHEEVPERLVAVAQIGPEM